MLYFETLLAAEVLQERSFPIEGEVFPARQQRVLLPLDARGVRYANGTVIAAG